ncbi:hypothetical protein MRB53_041897 [Persea americana]|nr:hypothetical protein MRB53_041897 [Persea americana]
MYSVESSEVQWDSGTPQPKMHLHHIDWRGFMHSRCPVECSEVQRILRRRQSEISRTWYSQQRRILIIALEVDTRCRYIISPPADVDRVVAKVQREGLYDSANCHADIQSSFEEVVVLLPPWLIATLDPVHEDEEMYSALVA